MQQTSQNMNVDCLRLVSELKNIDLRLKTQRQNQNQECNIHVLLMKYSHLDIFSWLLHTL